MDAQVYGKLIVAVVGLGVMLAARYGIDLSSQAQAFTDIALSLATAFGIYQVPNKPKEGA